jgi:hypothetical protein
MGQVIWSETATVVLAGWSNIFVQLLNVHWVNVWQTEIQTAGQLVPFEV